MLLAASAVVGCAPAPDPGQEESRTASAADVLHLPEKDVPLTGMPPLAYTVGKPSPGETPVVFGSVTDLGFDGQDNLYVLDGMNGRILVLDSTGSIVRSQGRLGGGPGEFRGPTAMAVAGDGRVLVVDEGKRAYVQFNAAGGTEGDTPMPPGAILGTRVRAIPNGGWGGVLSDLAPAGRAVGAEPRVGSFRRRAHPAVIARMPPDLSRIDTLHRAYREWVNLERTNKTGTGQFQTTEAGPPRFSPGVHWDALPDGGIVVASEAAYRIRLARPDGTVRATIERHLPVRRVSRADRRVQRNHVRERLESGNFQAIRDGRPVPLKLSPGSVERAVTEMRFARVWPAIRNLRTTPRGAMWVERIGRSLEEAGPVDVISHEGAYMGTVQIPLPAAFSPGGYAAFVEESNDGAEHVVVRRIPPAWR